MNLAHMGLEYWDTAGSISTRGLSVSEVTDNDLPVSSVYPGREMRIMRGIRHDPTFGGYHGEKRSKQWGFSCNMYGQVTSLPDKYPC